MTSAIYLLKLIWIYACTLFLVTLGVHNNNVDYSHIIKFLIKLNSFTSITFLLNCVVTYLSVIIVFLLSYIYLYLKRSKCFVSCNLLSQTEEIVICGIREWSSMLTAEAKLTETEGNKKRIHNILSLTSFW